MHNLFFNQFTMAVPIHFGPTRIYGEHSNKTRLSVKTMRVFFSLNTRPRPLRADRSSDGKEWNSKRC
jgi:hypothetical protein